MDPNHLNLLPSLGGDALALIALEAGALIEEIRARGCAVDAKADQSPVTEADEAAERLILARLAALAPDLPVLAEESVAAGRIPALGSLFACVDPLDGTREFVSGNADFTVNIAIVHEGRPIAGVIYAPARGLLAMAPLDGPPWWADVPVGTPLPPADARQRLAIVAPHAPPRAVASRSHRTAATNAFLDARGIDDCVSAGSSLKFCLIAQGLADLYPRLGPTMEWDTAAGQAIVEAAGGQVLTLDGEPLRYGKASQGFANPDFVVYGGVKPG